MEMNNILADFSKPQECPSQINHQCTAMNFGNNKQDYLRSIAIELNNAAVDIYEHGDYSLALDLYTSSFQTMRKIIHIDSALSLTSSLDKMIACNERKIAIGREKIHNYKKCSTDQKPVRTDRTDIYYEASPKLKNYAYLSEASKIGDVNDANYECAIMIFNLSLVYLQLGTNSLVKDLLQMTFNQCSDTRNDLTLKVDILNTLGCLAIKEGNYMNAIKILLDAETISKKVILKLSDSEVPLRLNRLLGILSNNIGRVYLLQGDYKEALVHCKESLHRKISSSVNHHEEICICVYNMGMVQSLTNEFSKAAESYEYFLRLTNNLFEDDNTFSSQDAVTILLSILNTYSENNIFGDKSSNILQYLITVQQLRKQHGNDCEELPSMYRCIGETFTELSYFQFANPFFIEQLRLDEKYLGHSHPSIGTTLNNIGETYQQQKMLPKALEYFNRALEILVIEKTEINIRQYAVTVYNVGKLFYHNSSFSLAIKNFTIALRVLREHFGDYDINLADMLHQIGIFQAQTGKLDESIQLFQEALLIRRMNYGNSHISVAETLFQIGRNHELRDEYKESLEVYHEALFIIKNQSKDTDLENIVLIITILNKISQANQAIRQLKEAITAHEEILRLLYATVGRNHTLVASLLNLLGNLYIEYGLSEQGLILYDTSEKIMTQIESKLNGKINSSLDSDFEKEIFEILGCNFIPNPTHAAAA